MALDRYWQIIKKVIGGDSVGESYRNDEDHIHEERKEQWYTNKDLFEKLGTLVDRFTSMEKTIIRFENKFERYNGLHDRVKTVEHRPCSKEPEIDTIKKAVEELTDELRFNQRTKDNEQKKKDKRTKSLVAVSLMVGIVGGLLGILSVLGVV